MKETEDTRELKVRSFDFIEGIQGSRTTWGRGTAELSNYGFKGAHL